MAVLNGARPGVAVGDRGLFGRERQRRWLARHWAGGRLALGLLVAGVGIVAYSAIDRYVVGDDGIARPTNRRQRRQMTRGADRRDALVRLTAAGLALVIIAAPAINERSSAAFTASAAATERPH